MFYDCTSSEEKGKYGSYIIHFVSPMLFVIEKGRASIQSKTKTKPKPNWSQSESKLRPKALKNQTLTTQVKHDFKMVSMLIVTQFRSKPRPN